MLLPFRLSSADLKQLNRDNTNKPQIWAFFDDVPFCENYSRLYLNGTHLEKHLD